MTEREIVHMALNDQAIRLHALRNKLSGAERDVAVLKRDIQVQQAIVSALEDRSTALLPAEIEVKP